MRHLATSFMALQRGGELSNRLRTILIVVVTLVWALNFTAPIFVKDYKPAAELNVAFMAILGVLTASYNRHPSSNSGSTGDNQMEKPDRKEIER
jgi:hypothetical protein